MSNTNHSPTRDHTLSRKGGGPNTANGKLKGSKAHYGTTTKLIKVTRLQTRKGSENINPKAVNKLVNKPLENTNKNNSVINEVAMDPRASSFSKIGTQSEVSNQLAMKNPKVEKSKESIESPGLAEQSKVVETK